MANLSSDQRLESESRDIAWLAVIGVVPVGMPSNAEDYLRRDLGARISEFLVARSH